MKAISLTQRLKSRGTSLLLGSALLLLSLGQQATAQAFTNAIVDYGDGSSIPHGILRTHTDGSTYGFWRDGTNSAVTTVPAEYKLIKWNGTGWTSIGNIVYNNIPNLLTGFSPGEYTDFAIDSNGGFHVALQVPLTVGGTGNGVVYAYSATGATGSWTYSTVFNYTGDNNSPLYVSLDLDSANKPHVFVLQKNIGTDMPFNQRIFTAWHYSSTNGTSWTAESIYSQNGETGTAGTSVNEVAEIAVTMDSNDKIHALLSVELNGNNRRNITYATNTSGAWVTSVLVPSNDTSQTTDMDLVVDSTNKIHAIYSPITDRVVHYLTNRSGSWVDTAINSGAVTGRIGATSKRGLAINSTNDLLLVYNSSPTTVNAGNLSYAYLPAATGNTWQTGSVFNGGTRTGDTITTTITDTGRAFTFFEHFSDPGGTGSPSNSTVPPNSRQLQYATAQFTPTLPTPNLTINDVTLNEGNTGTTSFTFTVSLSSAAPAGGVTFDIATANNTAIASGDYTSKSLTGQTIPAGSSTYSFTVLGNGDTTIESNETFFVNVTNATNATITDAQGIGTIVNDDVDTTPPDTSLASGPASVTNSTSATFDFSSNESPVTYEVSLDGAAYAASTDPVTFSGLAQGNHTLAVRAKDAALNVDATPATYAWTVDTTPPGTTLVSAPATFTNSTTATFSFSSNESPVSYEMSTNGTDYFATFSSPISFGNVGQGTRTFTFRAKDAAGNVDPTPVSHTWTVDTTPPAAPVTVTPANGSTTGATPSVTGTAEQNSTVTVLVDGSSIGTTNVDAAGNWTKAITTLGDGSHTVKARATDAAGNTGNDSNTNTFTVDATPPAAPVVTAPINNSRTNDSTPTFTGMAAQATSVTVTIAGTSYGPISVDGAGNWTFTVPTLGDASYNISITATDAVGNTSPTSSTITFTVDTTPPLAPMVNTPNGDRISDSTPLIGGTAENNATVTVYIDGASVGTATASAGGGWTFTAPTPLAEDGHTVKATATDAVGNVSPDSATNTFYVDTVAPVAPVVVAPANGLRTNSNMPTLHGTTEPYGTAYITLTGPTPLIGTMATGQLGVWVYPITTARADGEYTLSVYAKDQVGNTGPAAETVTFTVDTTAATVALSTTAPDPAPLSGFTVTAQFNEAVTDFSSADLVVANANVSDFTIVDADTYTFVLTPTAPGVTVTVNIAAGAGNDLAGNASAAATQFSKAVIDRAVSIAVALGPVTEGTGSGSTTYPFTVLRTGGTVGPVNINYAVSGSGAEPANAADFVGGTLPTGTVTIPDGQAIASFTLNIARDLIVELQETFTITLSNPDNGYVLDTASSGIGTIANDDSATLSVAKQTDGAEYPKVDGAFRVTLSAPASAPTLVGFTLGGTALGGGTDHTAPVGIATVTAGSTFVDIPIPVITDYLVEGTETVSIQLGTISSALPGITIGTPTTASLNIADNAPAAVVVNAGNSQSAVVTTAFATPLSVRVNDSQGNALSNATVTFIAPGPGVLVSGYFTDVPFPGNPSVVTNSAGIATAPTLTAGQVDGAFTVAASVSGVATPATFSLTNLVGAPHHYALLIPETATAGTPLTLAVSARDQYGNLITGYSGTVHLTSTDVGAILGADATLTDGAGTFSVIYVTGGSQTVTVTDTVNSAVTSTSNATVVTAQADLAVTVTDTPDPVQANQNVTYTLTVTNNGPSNAENVTFGLQLPAGVTFVSATRTVTGGWADGFITGVTTPPVGSTGTITITSSRIESYERYDIVGKVGYVGNGTVLTATGTAAATTGDPSSANNSATATTTVAANPEIALHNGDSTITPPITDGQPTVISFGTTTVNNPLTRSFTIANTGNDTLSISAIGVPSGFSLVAPFTAQQIAPTAAFTFAVRYDAGAITTVSGDIVIGNNDADESPFNIPITATRENVTPVALSQNLTIEEDEVKSIVLAGSDADEQPITFAIVDQPLNGTLTGTLPNVSYTPNADYNGADVFTFTTNDGTADSAEVEVNLTINAVNDQPRIVGTGIPDQIQIRPNVPRTIDLTPYFSDAETASANLTYTVQVTGGLLDPVVSPMSSLSPASYVETEVTGSSLQINGVAHGAFLIQVTATDSDTLSVSDTFTLSVKHVPQLAGTGVPPTLVSPSEPTFDLDLAGYFIDGDGDALTYAITNNTDTGVLTATINGSTVTITPVTPGVASLTILVADSDGNTISHTFEVTIDDPIPDATPTVTSPPKLNRQTGLYEITLTATNNNQFNVPGFRFRVTSALPAGMRLHNSTAPIGSSEAYLDVLTVLTPGQAITVVLEFDSTTRNFDGFNPTIIAEPLPEGIDNAGTGEGMAVNRFLNLPDGSKLIEFSSIAGRWYQIEYSSNCETWKRSLVPVQAGANFTQWIDRGAPYTESHPSTVPARFYRVSEILPE